MFYGEAYKYIPIIVLTAVINTVSGLFVLILLQFAKTHLQVVITSLRLAVYLILVVLFVLVLRFGLWGFAISSLLASYFGFLLAAIFAYKTIKIR